MDFLTVFLIALGLAMDAFAVSLSGGFAAGKATPRQTLRLAFHFGLFQFFMPILGWAAGLTVQNLIQAYDHWVAFALLAGIGGKMVYESFRTEGVEKRNRDITRGASLVLLSLATSIDALAVGLSLSLLRVRILYPSTVIGVVCFALTAFGFTFGSRLGRLLGRRMELLGGVVLIGIGVKILVGHLF
jgi:manganese efflux pump family protein